MTRCTALIALLVAGTACNRAIATSPYPVSATAAIERADIDIPRELDVRSVSYSVTTLPQVTGDRIGTTSDIQVRPLLTVFGVSRETGEQLVLIYDDPAQRRQPSRIIRLRPTEKSPPD
ncbi:MAG TPA: hypothetical protein VN706_12670 [Gemmatimonadaceae bacterium]|nr:hypothetical protein [Gemmatimonadaceae bacterium]